MNKKIISLVIVIAIQSANVFANSEVSQASNVSHIAASDIVAGSANLLKAGEELAVVSVSHSGNFVIALLKDAASGAEVSLRLSKQSLGNVSIASGQTIQMVASGVGTAMMLSGKLLAIIPNEIGSQLLHSSKEK